MTIADRLAALTPEELLEANDLARRYVGKSIEACDQADLLVILQGIHEHKSLLLHELDFAASNLAAVIRGHDAA
ncbi:hypothetical protein ACI3EY_03675 [Ornithinimicrobium sp. LYQ92]|uniref:hypothetical protein n=1 Tax=Serinicoccus sp. LYQ92 TaxID=3378798 RepID=UPI003854DCB2